MFGRAMRFWHGTVLGMMNIPLQMMVVALAGWVNEHNASRTALRLGADTASFGSRIACSGSGWANRVHLTVRARANSDGYKGRQAGFAQKLGQQLGQQLGQNNLTGKLAGLGLSPSIPVRSKRLEFAFRGGGVTLVLGTLGGGAGRKSNGKCRLPVLAEESEMLKMRSLFMRE